MTKKYLIFEVTINMMNMNFLRKYSITFQLFLFIAFLIFLIFILSTLFIVRFQKAVIQEQNNDYITNHIKSFDSELRLAHQKMQIGVKEDINLADWVFYRNYSGVIQVNKNKTIKYKAVNQISHDTSHISVYEWKMNGQIIQNDFTIVDKIKDLGASTVTIFQKIEAGYLRISTNVMTKKGERAIGTFIPNESDVITSIENGDRYQGRAFVVDDWYSTIYDPIYVNGEIKGILYVGEKENTASFLNTENKNKRILGEGYVFIMSDNDNSKGLMLMHPNLEGINIKSSGDTRSLELYNKLLNNFHQNSSENKTISLRLKNTKLGADVLVFYRYQPVFKYYIGIVIPYSSYIQDQMNTLWKFMFIRFFTVFPLTIILIFFFTLVYKKGLTRIIYSLHQLGKGIIPKPIRVMGRDEIAKTSKFINTLAASHKEFINKVQRVENGEYGVKIRIKSDQDQLAISFNNMAQQLHDFDDKHKHQLTMREAENDLFEKTRFANNMENYGAKALESIRQFLPIQIACFYYFNEENKVLLNKASIGIPINTQIKNIKLGEGIIGEVARDKIEVRVIEDIPKDFYKIKTGVGESYPKQITIIPLVLNDSLQGVVELASINTFSDRDWDLLNVYKDSLAISLNISKSRIELQTMLEHIQVQSEELRVTNETLEEQAKSLQVSEENLQVQQEELRVTNEELEIQAQSLMKNEEALTEQKNALEKEATDRIKAQKLLELSVEKANAATKAKSMFLANMSHEIRTPMNGVIGISDILSETELNKEQRNYLNLISTSADNLLTIINDILDFSKIEAGKIELETIPFSVKKLIEDTADVIQFKAAERGNQLFTYVDNKIPISMIGDPVRLQQVLMNLANNAVKFTSNGEVTISCEVVELKKKKAHLIFKIKDTGIGISAEGQERLFKSFTQVDASTTRKFGGTGLGLVISKKLVEKMNGSFGVESEEGKGSTFLFTTSFEIDTNESIKNKLDKRDYSDLNILVVDNHEASRMIFQKYLEAKSVIFESADSTSNGLKLIEEKYMTGNPFKLVYVDYQMPDMNGIQFIEKVQSNKKYKDLKFVLLTAQQNVIRSEQKKDLNISAYLDKPLKRLNLYNSIEQIIYGAKEKEFKDESPRKENEKIQKKFNILLTEDNLINQKVAVYNLKDWGHTVDVADNGEISFQKFKDGNYDLILMDIQMPVLDGLKATKKIRTYEKENNLKAITIIAMTANALKGDDQICFDAGMDEYISKPFKRADLEEIIYKKG